MILLNKKILYFLLIFLFLFIGNYIFAADDLALKLAGKIVLQVEQNGEAWYINPIDQRRYFLSRPDTAFDLIKKLGIGINDNDLNKIAPGILEYDDQDDDNDGLANRLEIAIGTDTNKADTDSDGYSDREEINNGYNPLGSGQQNIDKNFVNLNSGKIFIQTENHGEAWYINPIDSKRYYLGRPADAFLIMKKFGLGITDSNLNKITPGFINVIAPEIQESDNTQKNNLDTDSVISGAASAIRANNTASTLKYFRPEMHKAIEYTMNYLDDDGRLTLGNILSGSVLSEITETKATYTNEVYFSLGGYKVPLKFYIDKQADGTWLMSNL